MKVLLLICSFCFILKIQSQTIITAAGSGVAISGGDGGQFKNATFDHPGHMIYDKAGNLYIIEIYSGCIRKVDARSGIMTTLISGIYNPRGIALDRQEQYMYIAANACIYQLNMSNNVLSVFAGIPGLSCTYNICGDNVPALTAQFGSSTGVTVDSIGNVYVADFLGSRVRKIDIATGIISTYAGGGNCNCAGYGDGSPAVGSQLVFPTDVCFDNKGNLIIADAGLSNIRKVDAKTGIITTIAGLNAYPTSGSSGDGGPAVNARLNGPSGILIDKDDNLYITEELNSTVRKVDKLGIITTLAGIGTAGYSGDCGPADKAQLNHPQHAVVSPNGSVLIADFGNNVIREVINSVPNVITASINGLCVNSTLALKDSAKSGVWQSSNPNVAKVNSNGVITALSQGTVHISYNIVNGCNSNSSTIDITVYPTPAVPQINGATSVCEASTVNLTNTVGGGVWSSSDSSVAFINTYGLIKGISGGTAMIKYTITNDHCSSEDSVNIVVNPLPKIVAIAGDTSVCINSTTALTNAISGGTWSINNSGIAGINAATGIVNGRSAGKAIVFYTITNTCGTNAVHAGVKVNPLPFFFLGNDTSICENSKFLLQPSINDVSYKWEDGNNSDSHLITQQGSYWLQVIDSNLCSFSDTINILDKQLPPLRLGNDTTLCNNLPFSINVNDISIESYTWQDGSPQPSYTVQKAGKYNVTVTGYNGCINSDTINIDYLVSPVVNLGSNGTICSGNKIVINPQLNNVTYLWQDSSTASTYTVTQPGIYSLKATNFCGSGTADIEFEKGICRLLMPDAFTPNNDGLNDVFRVKYPDFIKTFHLKIFNRWGKMIFETTNVKQGWNGKYKNIEQDQGNYIWMITLSDYEGNTENAKGLVLLIR